MKNILEEYKTLREELMLHVRLERQIVGLSSTLIFVVLGVFANLDNPALNQLCGLTLLMLLAPITLLYTHETFAIAKIASYIQQHIESRVPNLSWTTKHIEGLNRFATSQDRHPWYRRVPHLSVRICVLLYFSTLTVLAWSLPFYFEASFYPVRVWVAMAIPTAIIAFSLLQLL
ncbi:MAG: hypothetical protein AAF456_21755, partial [Planctomycetota bacterium]